MVNLTHHVVHSGLHDELVVLGGTMTFSLVLVCPALLQDVFCKTFESCWV